MSIPLASHRPGTVIRRTVVLAALSLAALTGPPAAAQGVPDVVGQPVAQPADTLYREGTRALTKGNYRQAAGLFELLRVSFPRSPYLPDSYYWQAFALQRLDDPRAQQQALVVLDEQQLRFPESAANDDVLALRERVESLVGRELAGGTTSASCAEREDAASVAALNTLTMLTDAAAIHGYLSSLLAMRSPCARELRRSAVFLLGQRPDAGARRTLGVVVEKDPDETVRADARAALERAGTLASLTPAVRVLPPPRATGDTTTLLIGDSALARAITVSEPKGLKLPVRLQRPGQLIVLSVKVGEPPVVLTPTVPRDARRVASGGFTVDLSAVGQPTVYQVAESRFDDQRAYDLRRETAVELCVVRETAKAQAEINRQWAARPTQQGKPTVPLTQGGPADAVTRVGFMAARANALCMQEAARTLPPPPITSVMRSGLTVPATQDRYLVVLAAAEPVSMPWLLVRMGTVQPSGATLPVFIAHITRTLFAGHAGSWGGVVLPW